MTEKHILVDIEQGRADMLNDMICRPMSANKERYGEQALHTQYLNFMTGHGDECISYEIVPQEEIVESGSFNVILLKHWEKDQTFKTISYQTIGTVPSIEVGTEVEYHGTKYILQPHII